MLDESASAAQSFMPVRPTTGHMSAQWLGLEPKASATQKSSGFQPTELYGEYMAGQKQMPKGMTSQRESVANAWFGWFDGLATTEEKTLLLPQIGPGKL